MISLAFIPGVNGDFGSLSGLAKLDNILITAATNIAFDTSYYLNYSNLIGVNMSNNPLSTGDISVFANHPNKANIVTLTLSGQIYGNISAFVGYNNLQVLIVNT